MPHNISTLAQSRHDDSRTIELVKAIWAETLGLEAVGPHDDFFELGGHSLKAASVVARLGERVGFELPIDALFEAPTPAEMAELIGEIRDGSNPAAPDGISAFFPDWVVPLQRAGAGRPVFDFPSTDNEPGALAQDAHIAALVGRERPFWGFRQRHPHPARLREQGIPALAAAYVAQLQSIQGAGPYLLMANCGGGFPAWEGARQLLASGEEIAGILFFEVPLGASFDALVPGVTPPGASSPPQSSRDYRPPPLPVDLTFLMTDFWFDRGWWKPWQRATRGTFRPVVLDFGDARASDFIDRRARTIADHVRDWIDRAETRALDR